ncbi:adenylate/guanylate cyclase domain-containing protein [Labilibacter marinus]|uniref:adenylate/guanylate cyclase domain-containing protein n=1 Tax=Labilibacter marinus TaxID=1477105 RepID=UPI001179CD20|nr:adenylate/guanylate cyclase domain-containing protein [Labilibacter marinus]
MSAVKILIIGDDKISQQIIKGRLLEFDENWLIITKSCHDSQMELDASVYNLILVDCLFSSPQLIDKINQIKESNKNWNTPILISLQEAENNSIKEILAAGALDFIHKPFKTIELFARVRTGLTLSSSIQKLDKQAHLISEGENRISEVLSGLLPKEIINELTSTGESKPKKYRDASVLFIDLVDFTKKSTKLSPKILIDELTSIFSSFDAIIKKHHCTRIKTMGDGYLAVSGIPNPNKDHAQNLINAAIEVRDFLIERNQINPVKWDAKIGINSGEVIGSVLGTSNFLFDVFGDTVNVASRMEKNCEPNQINVGKNTYLKTRNSFRFIERLPNDIKGVGVKSMYYIKSKIKSSTLSDYETISQSLQDNFSYPSEIAI